MAKGVKKIKYIKGSHYPKMSVYGKRITIEPEKEVIFNIAEWLPDTTPEDKKKPITWIRQSNDRKVIVKQLLSTTGYMFQISKQLSGSYHYYIEASLSGKRDFKNISGLYVKGWCQPRIVSSKWCTKKGGDDVRKTYTFSYGHIIYLYLDTEGLNGDKVTVDVYKVVEGGGGTNDDRLIFTYTNVEVIDGQINLKIGNSYQWYGKIGKPKPKEEFYVKVKTASGKYVSDGKDTVHARFLRIKNELVSKEIETSTNNTPTKVGQPDKNKKNYHLCKFEHINVRDNDETFPVFKEGNTLLKKVSTETQFANFKVHFDFDRSDIRPDTKVVLKYLLDFLLFNQHLDMNLSGHADDRGTLDYNQSLSERRATAVKDFFVNGGLDKNRIKTRGFGEVNPLVAGKTEEVYKKNRRVEIDFSYLEYNQDAMVYETVVSNLDKPRKITVNILNREDKACFRKDKHKKTEVLVYDYGKVKYAKSGNAISHEVFANYFEFPKNYASLLVKFLNPLPPINVGRTILVQPIYYPFGFHINSCAYYANKNKATLEVRTYPDVVWIGHFQYNYSKAGTYFFHNKNFNDLTTGIKDVLNELKNTIFYKIWRILPGNFVVEKTLLEYIEGQALDYTYGIHTIHNRTLEKTGQDLSLVGTQTNLITQTKYTKYFAAGVIYGFVVVGIVIDLLLIYLTRGRNVITKLQKFANMAKRAESILKKMDDAGVELIPPSIAINAGMYYQKQKDGRLALVYEANLNANPLVAVNFKREFDLLKLITKKINEIQNAKHPKDPEVQKKLERNNKNNNKIAELFKSKGVSEIKGTIEVRGDLMFEQKIQYNFLTNTYSFTDKLGNLVSHAQNEKIIKEQISFNAYVVGTYKYDFDFDPLQSSIEGKIKIQLQGAAGVKLKYGVDTKGGRGLFVAQSLYCSGVEGTYSGSWKAENLFGLYEYETNDGKPKPFTLIEPFEVPLYEIQLFKS